MIVNSRSAWLKLLKKYQCSVAEHARCQQSNTVVARHLETGGQRIAQLISPDMSLADISEHRVVHIPPRTSGKPYFTALPEWLRESYPDYAILAWSSSSDFPLRIDTFIARIIKKIGFTNQQAQVYLGQLRLPDAVADIKRMNPRLEKAGLAHRLPHVELNALALARVSAGIQSLRRPRRDGVKT